MKNFKRLISGMITMMALFTILPVAAHAEWRNDSHGWWYTQGSSYNTGWQYIDGNWYYFYSDGYMAHDCYIGNYYLNSAGAWTTNVPTSTSNSSNSNGISNNTSNNQGQTVYASNNGIYHSSSTAHNMKNSTAMSLSDAQKAGYKACNKCY